MLKQHTKYIIAISSLLLTIIGGICGYTYPDNFSQFSVLGKILFNLFSFIMVPFILTVIILAIHGLGRMDKTLRSAGKILGFIVIMTVIGSLLASGASFLLPGDLEYNNMDERLFSDNTYNPFIYEAVRDFSPLTILRSIFPANPLSASVEGNVLGLVLFAFIIGLVLLRDERRSNIIIDFFKAAAELFKKTIGFLLPVLPIGLFFLTAGLFAQNDNNFYQGSGTQIFSSLGPLAITFLLSSGIFLIILLISVKLMAHRNPFTFLRDIFPAMLTSFATGNKTAAFPLIYTELTDTTEVDSRSSGLALPLGMIFNASGHTILFIVAAFFAASLFNIEITLLSFMIMTLVSILFSLVVNFIPYGSFVILINIMILPTEKIEGNIAAMFLIAGIWLFDRIAFSLSTACDAAGAAIVSETFDFKTVRGTTGSTRTRSPKREYKPKSERTVSTRGRKNGGEDRKSNGNDNRKGTAERNKRQSAVKVSAAVAKTKSADKTKGKDKDIRPERKKSEPANQRSKEAKPAKPERSIKSAKASTDIDKPIVRRPLKDEPVNDKKHPKVNNTPEPEPITEPKPQTKQQSFEIPPVPHHFLEKIQEDAKAKKDQDATNPEPSQSPAHSDNEPVQEPVSSLKPTTPEESIDDPFEREKAKISEQLSKLSIREALPKDEDSQQDPVADKTPESPAVEKSVFAEVDFVAETSSPEAPDEPSVETASDENQSDSMTPEKPEHNENTTVKNDDDASEIKETVPRSDEEEAGEPEKVMSYGRSRQPKGGFKKDKDKTTSEFTDTETVTYNSESMTFGRGRKKK